MATNLPPASNELLDGDAVMWAYNQGILKYAHCGAVPYPEARGVQRAIDITGVWEGTSASIPKAGGGTYADTDVPTWGDVQAWAAASTPSLPCNTAPTLVGTNVTFRQINPDGGYTYHYAIKIELTTPSNATTDWRCEIQKRISDSTTEPYASDDWWNAVPQPWQDFATGGPGVKHSHTDSNLIGERTYRYRARFYVPGRLAAGPWSAVKSVTTTTQNEPPAS